MPSIAIAVIAVIVALAIAIPVTAKIATSKYQKDVESKLGNADDKARQIIDDALKTAEAKKRESLLEVKEESIRTKNELDKERSRIAELRYSVMNAASSRRKRTSIRNPMRSRRRKQALSREKRNWQSRKRNCQLKRAKSTELERISGLTSEQAKEYLLKIVEDEVKHETAVMIKEMESRAKEEADKKAKEYVVKCDPEMRCRSCIRDNCISRTVAER